MPFKNTAERCGIYKITSPSGKFYIGSSINVSDRIARHKKHLEKKIHKNEVLQRAWEKYKGDLNFEQILICRKEDLLFYEQLCIDGLKPEYNLCPRASNTLGYKHTEETRAKLRAAMARRPPHSEETKRKISESIRNMVRKKRVQYPERDSSGKFVKAS